MSVARVLLILTLGGIAIACSSSSTTGGATSSGGPAEDAGGGADDAGDASDATADGSGASKSCEGACKTTALEADFGGQKRPLDRAQFGTDTTDALLHVEAHAGGDPACPTQQSPTPDRTLVVTGVPRRATGRTLTQADGVKGAFFDFKGDLGLAPLVRSTAMSVTVVAEDAATPPAWVALDVVATFAEGTVKGHLYGAFCLSLSD
jgi:hypothetical protein